MGQLTAARSTSRGERRRPRVARLRLAAAAIPLAAGEPGLAVRRAGTLIDFTVPADTSAHPLPAKAQVFDALARDQLGDARAAEASIERALSFAKPRACFCRSRWPRTSGVERLKQRRAPPTHSSWQRFSTCSPGKALAVRRHNGSLAR